jgi:hypothetical protein
MPSIAAHNAGVELSVLPVRTNAHGTVAGWPFFSSAGEFLPRLKAGIDYDARVALVRN